MVAFNEPDPSTVREGEMSTQMEREICKAPAGMFRIVHEDPRDHWPTRQTDLRSPEEVRAFLSQITGCMRETMKVFDEQGECVAL